jgi:hypothetical protein
VPVPTDQSAEAGDGVAAAAQRAKRAKVRISPPVCAWQDRSRAAVRRFDLIFFSVVALRRVVVVVDAEAAGAAAAAGGVAGTLPDMAGLQALTGSLDKLETLLKSREAQSNPAGRSHN